MMAIGVLAALRSRGIKVPGELALAGFDDIPLARLVVPPLTTVHVPTELLGQRGMERLLAALGGDGSTRSRPSAEVLATPLVVRGSFGAALASEARQSP
jgi:LacI family transcriptional regulator